MAEGGGVRGEGGWVERVSNSPRVWSGVLTCLYSHIGCVHVVIYHERTVSGCHMRLY